MGEDLPDFVRVRRTLSRAGVPISKADCFRELLEEDATTLTSTSNLRSLLCTKKPAEYRKI